MSLFVCWMFIIDDEIDCIKIANASIEEFKHLWSEILRVISESCELNGHDEGSAIQESEFKSAEAFRPFGQILVGRYTVGTLREVLTVWLNQSKEKLSFEILVGADIFFCNNRTTTTFLG